MNNRLRQLRVERGWTQVELAERAGVSRTSVGAIEQRRLKPSVDAAMRIARALESRVEEIFSLEGAGASRASCWARPHGSLPARFWSVRVGDRLVHHPVEVTAAGLLPHDGVVMRDGMQRGAAAEVAEETLVIACCDPAVSILLSLYAARCGRRAICLPRTSGESLRLLREGLVHAAGLHLAGLEEARGNGPAARRELGEGYSLLRIGNWETGVATSAGAGWSLGSLRRARLRWVGRPEGSGARICQDRVLSRRPPPRRVASSHRVVAEVVRGGFAQAGVCPRLVAEEAGLAFLPVRWERFDLCLKSDHLADRRVAELISTVRERRYREAIDPLPGYAVSRECGEIEPV